MVSFLSESIQCVRVHDEGNRAAGGELAHERTEFIALT